MVVKENFDFIYVTESNIGEAQVNGDDLIVSIDNVFVLQAHPLCKDKAGPYRGKFIFHNVYSSKREITEYIGNPRNPDGFKETYTVEYKGEKMNHQGSFREYAFEGISKNPSAWVNWCIKAEEFEFECDE